MTITIITGTRARDAWATVSCRAWTLPLSPHYSRSISHIPSGFHLSAFLPLLALLLHHIEPLTTSPDPTTAGQVDSTSRKTLCKVLLVVDRMSKWVALIKLKYWSNSSNIWCSINYNPSCIVFLSLLQTLYGIPGEPGRCSSSAGQWTCWLPLWGIWRVLPASCTGTDAASQCMLTINAD